jgi:hypothetical protein
MAIIRLPGPQEGGEIFGGSPFAETFSNFLLEQGVEEVNPGNVPLQNQFQTSLLANPNQNFVVQRLDRLLGGVNERARRSPLGGRRFSAETAFAASSDPTGQSGTNPEAIGDFSKLFQAGFGEFSERLRGIRSNPATFQVKGGQRSRRADFV